MPGVEVSVILPVRNGGAFLHEAVNSILNQSFQDFELLIVDDHSTDRAVRCLDRTDSRLTVLKNPHRGVVSAFNHALGKAGGQYIARMDADDISLRERLQAQLSFLRANPDIGVAGAGVEIFSDRALMGGNIHYQEWLNSVRTPGQVHRQMFVESPIPNPTAMFRREVLLQLGGYRDVDWPEDYDLFLRADRAGIRMGKAEGVLLRWREHENRLTRTDTKYSRNRFQQAKAHFLVHGRLADGPLLIWGAGPSGRLMYDLLSAQGREVEGFIDVHPRRIGGRKRDKPVWGTEQAGQWPAAFILVAVGARGARDEISGFLKQRGRVEGKDFLFVA